MFQSALLLVFPVAMAFAAATDLLTYKIPNSISIALVAAFLVLAPFSGLGWNGFLLHVATFAAVLALGFSLFTFGLFGGGDAKLLAAAALWIGYESLLPYMTMVAILGGVLAILLIGFRRFPLPEAASRLAWLARLHDPKSGIPYGIALAMAALWVFPSTKLFASLMAA